MALFVRKDFEVERADFNTILSSEDIKLYKDANGNNYYPRVLQYVFIKNPKLTVYNFHGLPGANKKDIPEREAQTKHLLEIINKDQNRKILTGDFNLNPDTNAIFTLEKIMNNLLRGSNFTTTRSRLYKRQSIMPFADYIFISPEIEAQDFKVLPDEVSDHLPLLLEFE